MDRLEFCARLLLLTFLYGFILSLIGGCLLKAPKQARFGALCAALGLLLFYPIAVAGTCWLKPSTVLEATIAVLLLGWIHVGRSDSANLLIRLQSATRQALWVTLLGIFFWAPGALGRNIGLFSEAGGDFTIYAGLPDKAGNSPLWHTGDLRSVTDALIHGNVWVPSELPSRAADPPSAGWSMRRIYDLRWGTLSTGWFALQDALSPIKVGGVEERYMALLSVLWALILALIHKLVWIRAGFRPAMFALAVTISSQNLVAVGYNHYFPQLLASVLLMSLLVLISLPPEARLSKQACFGLAAVGCFSVGVAYFPIWPAIVVPIAILFLYRNKQPEPRNSPGNASRPQKLSIVVWACLASLFLTAPLLAQAGKIISLRTVISHPTELHNAYSALGRPRPYDVNQLASFWGAFPLQRLPPYSGKNPATNPATWVIAAAGTSLFLLSLAGYFTKKDRGPKAAEQRDTFLFHRSLTFALLGYVAIQLYLGRTYEYTQYKAIAYVLPFVLLYLCLPVAWARKSRRISGLSTALRIALILGLFYFRVEGAIIISQGQEQAGVLDIALHKLARSIRSRDPEAFVLAYPPRASLFSPWELGLRDQKALIMKYYIYPVPKQILIHEADLPHVWLLSANQPQSPIPDTIRDRSLWAYRPLSSKGCMVEPTALQAQDPTLVEYKLLHHNSELLWLQKDNEFWVFNAGSTPTLNLALKEYSGTDSSEFLIELIYPVRKELSLPVSAHSGQDLLVQIPQQSWINLVGKEKPGLVVIRIPGTGYSGLFCGRN